jgi:AcrR family transcriptional regulator
VTAIADRAGVTRPTVYAHFPDERALFTACSGHVRATAPLPDPTPWRSIADRGARLATALGELYGYYERLEHLLENIERDAPLLPIVAEMDAHRSRYLDEVRDVLLDAWPKRGAVGQRLRPAIGHALEFGTWRSLVRHEGCETERAVQLMVTFVFAAATPPGA